MTDPALAFWLRHVAAEGGLWEPAGDTTYVVLPPVLRDAYRLQEELQVTADPDVGREDGATLLALGHPVLAQAAERVLASGDAGRRVLARPASVRPGTDVLAAGVRDAFPVDHGRIDLAGEPTFVWHSVVRVGALVSYELSAEDQFQEQAERWVDGPARCLLPPALAERLSRAAADGHDAPGTPTGDAPGGDLLAAVAEAHRLIDADAGARREVLSAQVRDAHEAERDRAAAYYADAIAGIERRLATAPGDRKPVLEQRLRSTREEEARRLAEIAEKYEGRHSIRPYRLHVIEVPALRVPADVRRGDRRYPMAFDWLLPAGAFSPVRCPSCGGDAPLVAGKQKLGCERCLPRTPRPSAPVPGGPGGEGGQGGQGGPGGQSASSRAVHPRRPRRLPRPGAPGRAACPLRPGGSRPPSRRMSGRNGARRRASSRNGCGMPLPPGPPETRAPSWPRDHRRPRCTGCWAPRGSPASLACQPARRRPGSARSPRALQATVTSSPACCSATAGPSATTTCAARMHWWPRCCPTP